MFYFFRSKLSPDLPSENVEKMRSATIRSVRYSCQATLFVASAGILPGSFPRGSIGRPLSVKKREVETLHELVRVCRMADLVDKPELMAQRCNKLHLTFLTLEKGL